MPEAKRREWTLEDFRTAHKPTRAVARVCLRQDLFAEHARLDVELHRASAADATENRDPIAHELAAQVQALEEEIAASEVEFVFQSIGQQAWIDLLSEHPPSDEHKELGIDHDPGTFPIAAVAASSVDPVIPPEVAAAMYADLNLSQWNRLWAACLAANAGGGSAPKSALATVIRRRPEPSSTTAVPEGSLEASS